MKITIDTPALIAAVKIARKVARTRTPNPILTCVHLTAAKGEPVTVQAHSGDSWVSVPVAQVDTAEPGVVSVDAARLDTALSHFAHLPTVVISSDGDSLLVQGDAGKVKMFITAGAFPPPMAIDKPVSIGVKGPELKTHLSRASIASALESTRYALCGVLAKSGKDGLFFASTDGKRMVLVQTGIKSANVQAIMPTMAVNFITLNAGEADGVLTFGGNAVGYRSDLIEYRSVLLEGSFAPIDDIVPPKTANGITFNALAMMNALAGAESTTSDAVRGVNFTRQGGNVSVSSMTAEIGESEFVVSATVAGTVPEVFRMNPQFAREMIEAAGTPEVTIQVDAANKPYVIRTEDGMIGLWAHIAAT